MSGPERLPSQAKGVREPSAPGAKPDEEMVEGPAFITAQPDRRARLVEALSPSPFAGCMVLLADLSAPRKRKPSRPFSP